MTKLAELMNDFYVNGDEFSVADLISDAEMSLTHEEQVVEYKKLLLHLDTVIK